MFVLTVTAVRCDKPHTFELQLVESDVVYVAEQHPCRA